MRAAIIIFFVFLLTLSAIPSFSQTPVLWGKLKPGPYAVGFKTTETFDYSRFEENKYDSTGQYKSGRQRPMLISTWYPAKQKTGLKMNLSDLILKGTIAHHQNVEKEAASEIAMFKRFLQFPHVFGIKDIPDALFKKAMSEEMFAKFNAIPVATDQPVIFCTGEPYFLSITCEWLASYGYTIALITAPGPKDQLPVSKLFEGAVADMEWLYGYLYKSLDLEKRKTAVLGFGGGSQAPYYLCMKNKEIDAFINLEGGIFGKRSESHKADSYNPATYKTPLLNIYIAPQQEKENVQEQIDTLKNVPLVMMGFTPIILKHHDFSILGRVAMESLRLRDDPSDVIEKSYSAAHESMLLFLDRYLKNKETSIPANPLLYNVKIIKN